MNDLDIVADRIEPGQVDMEEKAQSQQTIRSQTGLGIKTPSVITDAL
jgi:hypothetical protein